MKLRFRLRTQRALTGIYRQLNERSTQGPGIRGQRIPQYKARNINKLTEDEILLHIRARIPQVLSKRDIAEAAYIMGLYQGLSHPKQSTADEQSDFEESAYCIRVATDRYRDLDVGEIARQVARESLTKKGSPC